MLQQTYDLILLQNEELLQQEFNRINLLTRNISMFPGSGSDTISYRQAFKVIENLYDTMNKLKDEGKISPEAHARLLNQIIR